MKEPSAASLCVTIAAAEVGSLVGTRSRDPQHGVLGEEVDRLLPRVVVDQLQEEVDRLGGTHRRQDT